MVLSVGKFVSKVFLFLSLCDLSSYTPVPIDAFGLLGPLPGRYPMRICDLIKDQDTYQAELGDTVLETVRAMVERNIGAVPVLHKGKLVGIFSERDLMRRVVA